MAVTLMNGLDTLRAQGPYGGCEKHVITARQTSSGLTPTRADLLACGSVPRQSQVINDNPFVLVGSVEQVIDKFERLRADVGISHSVVNSATRLAPVVAALTGR